ncbi:MAG TPA: hypothetical protein VFZ03_11370 [Dongiaceae bacterium]
MATTTWAESMDRVEPAADTAESDGTGRDRPVAEATVQPPATSSVEAVAANAEEAGARRPSPTFVDAPAAAPPDIDRPGLDRDPLEANAAPVVPTPAAADIGIRSAPTLEPALPRIDTRTNDTPANDTPANDTPANETLTNDTLAIDNLAAEMHEAELLARASSAAADLTSDGGAARAVPREPVFDVRAARARASQADPTTQPEAGAVVREAGGAPENADAARAAAGPPATDPQITQSEESDRSENRDRLYPATARADVTPAAAADSAPAASARRLKIAAPGRLSIEPAGPRPRAAPAGIELPSIETRIEARRIATLRADPWIAGRRSIFPHIEPEDRIVPSTAVAARARRQRRGTGWAIGLGALLLIVGITAPAAIWQGRQANPGDQDQVAALAPPPTSQAANEAAPKAAFQAQQGANIAPPADAPDQPAVPPPPARQAAAAPTASSSGSSSPPPEPRAGSAEQAALAPVRESGELNKAPVRSPPPPAAAPDRAFSPVAHAFVPEAVPKPTPFRPEPSPIMPVASVPANGGASVPLDGSPESVSLKPRLIGQLKPRAPAAAETTDAAPQRAAAKPRVAYPPTLDQMFQTLIDTLSSGQPVNSDSKPIPPSTRR